MRCLERKRRYPRASTKEESLMQSPRVDDRRVPGCPRGNATLRPIRRSVGRGRRVVLTGARRTLPLLPLRSASVWNMCLRHRGHLRPPASVTRLPFPAISCQVDGRGGAPFLYGADVALVSADWRRPSQRYSRSVRHLSRARVTIYNIRGF